MKIALVILINLDFLADSLVDLSMLMVAALHLEIIFKPIEPVSLAFHRIRVRFEDTPCTTRCALFCRYNEST